ncbi:hypothetical protein ACCQ10_07470 [Xanthomonas sp. NCPPB 1325]|uniref:hypothetical protein n=1 Tax=Xanthomonas sp. NCPPB 1325 TaxID=487529 RepID=UPI0035592E93
MKNPAEMRGFSSFGIWPDWQIAAAPSSSMRCMALTQALANADLATLMPKRKKPRRSEVFYDLP